MKAPRDTQAKLAKVADSDDAEIVFLASVWRLVLTIEAIERLPLPYEDRAAIGRLVSMLPTSKLGAELRAVDASHAEHGIGAGQRPSDGTEVYLRAKVHGVMVALGATRKQNRR